MFPDAYNIQNSKQSNPFTSLLGGLNYKGAVFPNIAPMARTGFAPNGAPMSPAPNYQGRIAYTAPSKSPFQVNKSGGASFTLPVTGSAPTAPSATPVASPNTPGAVATAPAITPPTPPTGMTTPSGVPVTGDPATFSGFSIPTSGAVDSAALGSNATMTDILKQRSKYQEYLEGLYKATIPSPEYLDALRASQEAKQAQMQIQADFLTSPNYPGDTYGFAQGVQGRQLALNALQQNAAANVLAVQEAIRTGNIDAYKALVSGAAPTGLSYGQTLTDPITGAPIAVGQNQPSFSAVASPFGGYLIFNQRTGQYEPVSADALYGGVAGGGGQKTLPTFLQPSLGQTPSGQQYLDSSVITSAQLPYAQQISASLGIPLLSKEDVNKIQEATATYNAGVGLIENVASLANGLIYANSPGEAIGQAAFLGAQAAIPGTQARLYQDARNGFLSLITRAAGEKGTLAQGDVERIQAALPSFSDTVGTAATKIQTLNNIFLSAVEGNISAYLGSKVYTPTGAPSSQGGGIDISQYSF